MKFRYLIFIFFLFFASHQLCHSEINDGIVAVANDDVILLSDLKNHIKKSGDNPLNKKNYLKYIKELTDLKLLELQGKRMGIQVTEEKLDLIERDMRAKGGDEAFEDEIKKAGMNRYRVRFGWRNQLLRDSISSVIVRNKIVVTEREIKNYYKKNYGGIVEQDLVSLLLVVIDKRKLATEQIKEIENNLKTNNNPEELIRDYLNSDKIEKESGDLGYLDPNSLDRTIVDIIINTEVGSIAGPFYSENLIKYFIVQGKIFGDVNYLKSKDEIRKLIYDEKAFLLLDGWFQQLRDNAYISVRI